MTPERVAPRAGTETLDRPIFLNYSGESAEIPPSDVEVEYSRASGPGGQHVNKTETRVTLRLNLVSCEAIPSVMRIRLLDKLSTRLTKGQELLISCDKHRERSRNIADASERMQEILAQALVVPKPRRATRPSKGSQERRLKEKRITSEKKKGRRSGHDD